MGGSRRDAAVGRRARAARARPRREPARRRAAAAPDPPVPARGRRLRRLARRAAALHAPPARDRRPGGRATSSGSRRPTPSTRANPPRWRRSPARWDFAEVNDLIERHNRWYPVEARLAMDPRSRDFVKVGGRDYRREPLDAGGSSRAFPRRLEPAHCRSVSDHRTITTTTTIMTTITTTRSSSTTRRDRGCRGARARAGPPARPRADPPVPRRRPPHEGEGGHRVRRVPDAARRADDQPDGRRPGRRPRRDAGGGPAAAVRLRPRGRGPEGGRQPAAASTARDEKETEEEGCLSLEGVRVPVERSTKVTLEGVDPERRRGSVRARGARARGSCSTRPTTSTAC